jgi:hypothetical protein
MMRVSNSSQAPYHSLDDRVGITVRCAFDFAQYAMNGPGFRREWCSPSTGLNRGVVSSKNLPRKVLNDCHVRGQ